MLNNVKRYPKPHTSENGGTVVYNTSGGNTFNGQNLNIKSITSVQGDIDDLRVRYIRGEEGNISLINADNANIKSAVGEVLEFTQGLINDLTSNNIKTVNLTAEDNITTNNLTSQNIISNSITTDTLYVNKSAHFFELVIDKIRSVNGTFINTAANCKIDFVEGYDINDNLVDMDDPNFDPDDVDYFKVYWKKTDDDGNAVENMWVTNDFAICQSFNAQTGTQYTTNNKYYWRLVTDKDNGPVWINFDTMRTSAVDPSSFSLTFTTPFRYGENNNYINLVVNGEHYASNVWSPTNIDEQLIITPPVQTITETDTVEGQTTIYEKSICENGALNFVTNKPSKLNITIIYDDGTIEYKQVVDNNTGEQIYETNYNIITTVGKEVDRFIITTSVIDKWDACNWITISNDANNNLYDPNSNGLPEIGDEIAQLGYRYDAQGATLGQSRASAIIIAAYMTPDSGLTPPSYAQYQYINPLKNNTPANWNLGDYRATYFDANGGCIVGDFRVKNDTTKHKTEILSSDGTFNMYGPSDPNDIPNSTYQQTLKIDWALSDNQDGICGLISVLEAGHPNMKCELWPDKLIIEDDHNTFGSSLRIDLNGISFSKWYPNSTRDDYFKDWPTLLS